MNVIYRQGKKEDSYRIAELDYRASDGAVEFLFHDLVPGATPVQVVCSGLEQDSYPHSYRSAIVAELDGEIIGMALSYPAKYHGINEQMRRFFPADRLEHFGDFYAARVEGSYLLDALCVEQHYRNKGIGRALLERTKSKARDEGYNLLSLIVFADNTRARKLYEDNGFTWVRTIALQPHALMPHQGGCILMKCEI